MNAVKYCQLARPFQLSAAKI